MSLSDSTVMEMIRANEKHKKYFYKTIEPRFSDCIYDRRMHYSKMFEFFEMARFDIMHAFYDFYQKRSNCTGDVSLGSFVVVRLQCENFEALTRPVLGSVGIKTSLTVHQKPLLEFEQHAYNASGEPLTQASMKLAIVDPTFRTVDVWDRDVLIAMLEFIDTHGKEDTP